MYTSTFTYTSPPTSPSTWIPHQFTQSGEANIHFQTSEEVFDEKLSALKEMIAGLTAHVTGSQHSSKRFSNILGIPEIKA